MKWILDIPLDARLAVLFVLGACLGGLANLAIYRLAWRPRPIGPWLRPDRKAPARHWADRIPIFGWLGLRREAVLHGPGFWIRPMFLELFCGAGLAALYCWEVDSAGLLPPDLPRRVPTDVAAILHAQFAAHLVLIWLIVVASAIDIDEKTIPDAITVPGVLLGLVAAAVLPCSLLPEFAEPIWKLQGMVPPNFWHPGLHEPWPFLHVASPNGWPNTLGGFPQIWPLMAGLGCWWLWCVALMPRSWYSRHGWRRALTLCVARVIRDRATRRILVMGLAGSAGIAAVWGMGGMHWTGLLSALIGMAAGGGLVWAVRVIATACLNREAMGFGDVTLMAMIGAFLGWQVCLVVFFLAPLAALGVGVLRLVLLRDHEIPYGPFLGLAAMVVIVYWAAIWGRLWVYFEIPWLVPSAVVGCLVLMPAILVLIQLAKRVLKQLAKKLFG